MIPHARKLHAAFKLWMPQYFAAHALLSGASLIHAHGFSDWVYVDDARGETFLEFFRVLRGARLLGIEDDVRKEAVARRRYMRN